MGGVGSGHLQGVTVGPWPKGVSGQLDVTAMRKTERRTVPRRLSLPGPPRWAGAEAQAVDHTRRVSLPMRRAIFTVPMLLE